MEGFRTIGASELRENPLRLFGNENMLITAADGTRHNSMTAAYGGIGTIWSCSVAFVYIRPQRYTHEIADVTDKFALSFFGEGNYRAELASIYGKLRGSDVDKDALAHFTPITLPSGAVAYKEARLIFECRKLYVQDMKEECFCDKAIVERHFGGRDFHTEYILEILNIWVKE